MVKRHARVECVQKLTGVVTQHVALSAEHKQFGHRLALVHKEPNAQFRCTNGKRGTERFKCTCPVAGGELSQRIEDLSVCDESKPSQM